jgi:hypothetical protein
MGVSGETPKRELAEILARYERGEIDVLVNAQLLAEGWNSPRATICMHLAPTASKRIYQQRVGRVTRRHPGKESGIVVDFVHPATRHDDPVVTLHSLLDREVYRGGAIVVGPVRRGRGRRVRVERRVIPVTADMDKRIEVFERELWRIAVEFLDYGEQVQWAALAGARVAPSGWRRARAMLHFDKSGELKRSFLLTAVERNKNSQLRLRALQEIAQSRDADAFERAVDVVRLWSRDERREGVKILLQALAERRIGRRDQASHWIWDLADMTREVHEEYAVQRWPETKRLLGLLVNSSGGAHARNARRLVHAARKQDRRLSAALLAAAVAHTPEAMEVVRGARTRMARKPSALSRELLRNFPKRKNRSRRRRGKKGDEGKAPQVEVAVGAVEVASGGGAGGAVAGGSSNGDGDGEQISARRRRRRTRRKNAAARAAAAREAAAAANAEGGANVEGASDNGSTGDGQRQERSSTPTPVDGEHAAREIEAVAALLSGRSGAEPANASAEVEGDAPAKSRSTRRRRSPVAAAQGDGENGTAPAAEPVADAEAEAPKPRRRRTTPKAAVVADEAPAAEEAPAPKPRTRRTAAARAAEEEAAAAPKPRTRRTAADDEGEAPKPRARRTAAAKAAEDEGTPKPRTRRTAAAKAADDEEAARPKPRARRTTKAAEADPAADEVPKPKRRTAAAKAAEEVAATATEEKPKRKRAPAKPKAAADATADEKPKPARRTRAKAAAVEPEQLSLDAPAEDAPKPKRRTTRRKATGDELDDAA